MMHRAHIATAPLFPRWLRVAVPAFFALATVAGCGGSGSSPGSQGGSGAGGSGGSGGSVTGGSAGMDAGQDVSTVQDAGNDVQQDVSQPDTGTDACQPTNGGVEICDGLDNDCNGKTDDNVPVPGTTKHTGDPCNGCNAVYKCVQFKTQPVCDSDAGAAQEICDGIDNNCNGQTDEGLTAQACDVPGKTGLYYNNVPTSAPNYEAASVCKQGTQTCTKTSAGWGACTNFQGPDAKETCDGKDDNCDGLVDNVAAADIKTCTGCDSSGNSTTANQTCNGSAGWSCPLTKPLYWYLDADNDGFFQPPVSNMSGVLGAVVINYSYGPSCSPPTLPVDGGGNFKSSTYDWTDPTQRNADPLFTTNNPDKKFDCCDADVDAKPGQTKYFRAPDHAPIPSECTAQGVQPWDFNCDGSYQHIAPDGTSTWWKQCADNCSQTPGWDTTTGISGHCWHDCGDSAGHWISQQGTLCTVTKWDSWSPECH